MSVYIVFVSFIDTMAQLPILSPFVAGLGAGAVFTGLILGSYSFVNMAGNVLVGPLIDLHGRRAAIIAGLLLAGAAVALYAVAAGPRQLLLLRVLHGAGGAVLIPAVFAYAGDLTRPGSVGAGMGRVGAAIALAATFGPALGGIGAARVGPRGVFLFVGLLLIVSAIVFFLRERVKAEPSLGDASGATHRSESRGEYLQRIMLAIRDPRLVGTYAATFGLTFAMGTLAYALPLRVQEIGLSSAHTGAFFGLFSLCAMALFLLPSNRIGDRVGFARTASFGSLAIALSLSLLTFASQAVLIAAAMVVYGLGFGLMFPAVCASVVVHGGAEGRGAAFGAFSAVYSLGVSLGPLSSGLLSGVGITPYLGALFAIGLTQLLHHRLELRSTASRTAGSETVYPSESR